MSMDIAKAGWLHRQSTFLLRWKKAWFILYTNGDLKYYKSQDYVYQPEATLRMKTECLTLQIGRACGVNPPDGCKRDACLTVVGRSETWNLCAEDTDDARAWQFSLEQARVISVAPAFKPQHRDPNAPPAYPTGPPPPYTQGPQPGSYPAQAQHQQAGPYLAQAQHQQAGPYPVQTQCVGAAYPRQRVVYAYPGQQYYGSHPPPYVVPNQDGTNTTIIYQNNQRQRYDGGDVAMGMMAGAALGTMLFW